jgi:hypothetical protein
VSSGQHHKNQQVAPSPWQSMQSHAWFADDNSESLAAGDGISQLVSEVMIQ